MSNPSLRHRTVVSFRCTQCSVSWPTPEPDPSADALNLRRRLGIKLCPQCEKLQRYAPLRLGYECPGWKYGRYGYRCPSLTFEPEPPKVEKLVGTYDVVFLAIDQQFSPRYHRRVKGTLVLGLEDERRVPQPSFFSTGDELNALMEEETDVNDVEMADAACVRHDHDSEDDTMEDTKRPWNKRSAALTSSLRGVVIMDSRSEISDPSWTRALTFATHPPKKAVGFSHGDGKNEDENANDGEETVKVNVRGFTQGGCLSYRGRELPNAPTLQAQTNRVQNSSDTSSANGNAAKPISALHGQLRIVSKRLLVRSRPDAKATHRRPSVAPAIYNTSQEADAILDRHRRSIAPFLSNNLQLPAGPATLICEYWTERPCPLFEFREGDVCLTTVMPGRGFMNDTVSTVLVARRRWVEE